MRRREGTGELRKQVFELSGNEVEGGENRLRLGFWRWKCDACERAFKGIFGSDWSPNKERERREAVNRRVYSLLERFK